MGRSGSSTTPGKHIAWKSDGGDRALLVGVTWQGLLLAAAGQFLVIGGIALALRQPRRGWLRLAWSVLAADALIFVLLVFLRALFDSLNHGSHYWRAVVVTGHLLLAVAVPWALWEVAIRAAAGRRVPFSGGILVALTAIGLTAPGVMFSWARGPAQVTRAEVRLRRLPRALDGVRIILVSDIHVGPHLSLGQARGRLAPLRKLKADLLACTGDLGTGSRAGLRATARMLRKMAPPMPRFAVLGNHELWIDEALAVRELRGNRFDTLVNESRKVRLRGVDFWIVGVSDPQSDADDLPLALAKVPGSAFVVLLSHSPDIVRRPMASRADLILAGHTHGGQVVLPLVGPLACSSFYGPRYASGLFHVGRSMMFVTRGLGEVIVPLRVFCPPEVAVLTLRAPGSQTPSE